MTNTNTNRSLAVATGAGSSVVETSKAGADIITAGDRICDKSNAFLLLWNYAGRPNSSGSLPSGYVSYPTSSDEYKAIRWAYKNNYISGTTYNYTMTRAHFALIMYRYAGTPASNTNVEQYYSDCSNLSNGFKKAIVWMKGKIFMSGNSNGTFSPNGTINRVNVTNVIKKYDSLP